MKIIYKKIFIFSLILLSFLIFSSALAFTPLYNQYLNQAAVPGAGYPGSQASEDFINTRIGQIVGVIVGLTGIIFLGLTVFSGIQWMTAGGNEEKVTQAKKRVINGTVGVGLTLCAFIIANLYFTFFESKFLQQPPASNVPLAPYGYQNIPCQTDAQCADRNGPNTGAPMFCSGGKCVECDSDEECNAMPLVGPNIWYCDTEYGLCANASGDCQTYNLSPQGPQIDACIYDPNCVWLVDPTQEEWDDGECVDNSASSCPQCTEQQPFCCDGCGPGYEDECVECINSDNCEDYGIPLNPNICTGSHTCTF